MGWKDGAGGGKDGPSTTKVPPQGQEGRGWATPDTKEKSPPSFPETCILQSVLPSFHTHVDVGGFAKRVSGHVSCHPPPAPRPPTCGERALFWKQPEALWSLGWRVEWVAVLRRPLLLAVRPFPQAGLGRAGDSVSKVAGASACVQPGAGVCVLGRSFLGRLGRASGVLSLHCPVRVSGTLPPETQQGRRSSAGAVRPLAPWRPPSRAPGSGLEPGSTFLCWAVLAPGERGCLPAPVLMAVGVLQRFLGSEASVCGGPGLVSLPEGPWPC